MKSQTHKEELQQRNRLGTVSRTTRKLQQTYTHLGNSALPREGELLNNIKRIKPAFHRKQNEQTREIETEILP